ncbi:hypothetical protein L207DRAFT_572532 [Hyaloscypha variabilis F]|uniref:HypA-like protein n=1 Tax=Hyaloscypha variabilis (strain UAMH 11265 / GT02V1 / F) TaxID=1149755 RepID=A0A2J6QZT7_HYAVF|nr:hypothetical protein L207DRAFT_572532 [Hyaloscypha variabilis F]
MATGKKISLSSGDKGVFHTGRISAESANKASELLQMNHDEYHIYFNEIGLHNHLAHHVLSLFAVGASPHVLQTLFDLNNDLYTDDKLSCSARWEDREKLVDGVLTRATEELIEFGSQWKVAESDLERKTAEMINACFVFTFAAQRPPKRIKLDFYYIHCTNASIFFSSFLRQDWLSTASKIRLLEWKGRMDLAIYASRGCPEILLDELTTYVLRSGGSEVDGWKKVFERAMSYVDSHAIKGQRIRITGEF